MDLPKRIQERRQSVRIQETLLFTIGHDGYDIEARTLNIGLHGVMCAVDREIPMMTQLKISLTLPKFGKSKSLEKTLRLKGVVVRRDRDPASGKFQIAIFFSDLKPEDTAVLKEFIEHRLSQ
jgi:hypothetical protein